MTNRNFIRNLALALTALGGCAGLLCAAPVSAMENREPELKWIKKDIKLGKGIAHVSINNLFRWSIEDHTHEDKMPDSCRMNRRYLQEFGDCLYFIGDDITDDEKAQTKRLIQHSTRWALKWIQEYEKPSASNKKNRKIPPFQTPLSDLNDHFKDFMSAIIKLEDLTKRYYDNYNVTKQKIMQIITNVRNYCKNQSDGLMGQSSFVEDDLKTINKIINI